MSEPQQRYWAWVGLSCCISKKKKKKKNEQILGNLTKHHLIAKPLLCLTHEKALHSSSGMHMSTHTRAHAGMHSATHTSGDIK